MRNAIYFEDNITDEQYQMAVRVLEAMNIGIKKIAEKTPKISDTKMSEEAFYQMVDERLKTPLSECRVLDENYKQELFG
ncbi:MAG: hypothetical protein CR974_01305 [Gammaproteobacteria bacterium]|nr:MAG: hypothetical protein CR974_01305 [Gammaproteobacteria bacterium]